MGGVDNGAIGWISELVRFFYLHSFKAITTSAALDIIPQNMIKGSTTRPIANY
jgi:hypothetical protein